MTAPGKTALLPNLLLALAASVLALLLAEFAYRGYLVYRLLTSVDPELKTVMTKYDPLLGWRHIPGRVTGRVIIDRLGFRARSMSARERVYGSPLIAVLGDSYAYGGEVRGHQAWAARLEDKVSGRGYSVANMGVCAYGVGQMYLLYREEKARLDPAVVLVSIISWDIPRTARSSWEGGREKPLFVWEQGALKLTNVPVPLRPDCITTKVVWTEVLFDAGSCHLLKLLRSCLNRPYYPEITEAEYRAAGVEPNKWGRGAFVAQKILEQWRREAEGEGRRFVVVVIPTAKEVDYYHSYLIRLRDNLRKGGVEVVDCQAAFQENRDRGVDLFTALHPSYHAHKIIAAAVYDHLFPGAK